MQPEEKPQRLVDGFSRNISYLRLSVTDRCNLRCRYCAPLLPKPMDTDRLLTLSEMNRLAGIAVNLGIRKVRLTGGEPLCRKGVTRLITGLAAMPQVEDISMTTNGTQLAQGAQQLRDAGLNRINISLDTLDRIKYRELTGFDKFDTVWQGVMKAAQVGLGPIKLNVVVMKGVNDDELASMAELSMRYPFHIRFIEYMPIGTDPQQAGNYFLPVTEIRRRLGRIAPLVPVERSQKDGPALRFRFAGAPGEIGLIGSMSAHFCDACNRLRLTADGRLRACLLAEETVDVRTPMRNGASDQALAARMIQAVRHKKEKHGMDFTRNKVLQTQMVSIGG